MWGFFKMLQQADPLWVQPPLSAAVRRDVEKIWAQEGVLEL